VDTNLPRVTTEPALPLLRDKVNLKYVWIKCGLVFEHEVLESTLAWLSNTKCSNKLWLGDRPRNVLMKCGLVFEHEMCDSKLVMF
jgi:hypothetical protein